MGGVSPFPEGRDGVLVVRARLEGRPPVMRLRITGVRDLAGPEYHVAHAATVDDAVRVIARWLEDFAAGDAAVTDD